jgi:phage-related protein
VALTAWLNEPNIKPLFFDETPHKVYSAKVTGKVTAKVVIFDDETNGRVYKGDGSITFTCYFPFARGNSETISVNNAFGNLIVPRKVTYRCGTTQTYVLGTSG